jgi:hypothetical protein
LILIEPIAAVIVALLGIALSHALGGGNVHRFSATYLATRNADWFLARQSFATSTHAFFENAIPNVGCQ